MSDTSFPVSPSISATSWSRFSVRYDSTVWFSRSSFLSFRAFFLDSRSSSSRSSNGRVATAVAIPLCLRAGLGALLVVPPRERDRFSRGFFARSFARGLGDFLAIGAPLKLST